MLNFAKYKLIYFFISLLVILPGVYSLVRFGLKLSIDFTGGTLWEISFDNQGLHETDIRQALPDTNIASIQITPDSFIIRTLALTEPEHQVLKTTLTNTLGNLHDVRFESVGPTLGQELLRRTTIAVAVASVSILLFVAYRFKNFSFGIAAILAMFHDSLVLIGSFSLLGHFFGIEVDTLFVTAALTILSFSVHDTIVVFDRIRETRRLHPTADFESVVNKSIAETLGRSINNSMTIIFMLLSLFLLGGPTIKYFVLALLIGTISGTYSSPFTATPLLLVWHSLRNKPLST